MAANSNRALTLSIVADIDNLQKGLNKADTEIETFGSKVGAFGKRLLLHLQLLLLLPLLMALN